ncbi:hypothetical protein SKAU_G00364860 [Synaphobranchus kaupii]|uniref:Ependymin n=1 Tax=Synaphobranchus kaupii TaxID=118154 RepID=A0A9Q1EEV2_SYNKA|nr:hypothetical protein SKAU_G00364860 [Synaphobranchus kaupii]
MCCLFALQADTNGELATYGRYKYDALGKKVRFFEMGMYKNTTFSVDLLVLFNEGVLYEIDWTRFRCTKKALRTEFQPMQVPKDAVLMGQTIMGTASAFAQGLLVNTWVGQIKETNAKYMSVFTGIGCVPLSYMEHNEKTGWAMVNYFNNMLGIDNPQAFFPPSICRNAELVGTTDFLEALLGEDAMQE